MVRAGVVLALDASATTGTVAVLRDGIVVSEREEVMRNDAEERFLPAVLDALEVVGESLGSLSAVACGGGPGSFTSLRVAAATAKGIAEGRGIPLYAMPSLALIVASGIGVLAGGLVSQYIGEKQLHYIAGIGFIAIGAWTLIKA